MRGEHEVVFESASRFMIDEVNAGIGVSISDTGIMRDMRVPVGGIVADEVMALPGQLLKADHRRSRVRADQSHTQHGSPTPTLPLRGGGEGGGAESCRLFEDQHRFAGGQEQNVPSTSRQEPHGGIGLASVGFEAQRNRGMDLTEAGLIDRNEPCEKDDKCCEKPYACLKGRSLHAPPSADMEGSLSSTVHRGCPTHRSPWDASWREGLPLHPPPPRSS